MLQLAACGFLWPEQRRHEAFLQDHANCRVVTPRKLKQKSIVSTFAKGAPRANPTLLTLLPGLTGFCLKLERASRNLSCDLSARSETRLLVGGEA